MNVSSRVRRAGRWMQVGSLLGATTIFGGASYAKQAGTITQQRQGGIRPNILLIVADDMGWSDIEPFGSEIRTPHLTSLAAEGMRFTRFYGGPACSPTRSMLLSGTDNHLAGMGTNAEVISEEQRGKPGYEGYLNDRVVSVAETLATSGYETFMAGKWHLGEEPEHWPDKRGFQRSFAMMLGGVSHFGDEAPMCNDYYPIYAEDGKRTHTPDDFYSSTFYADKIIQNLTKAGVDPTSYHLTGANILTGQLKELILQNLKTSLGLAILCIMVVLWVYFRNIRVRDLD